jgi:hypothetical protein
MQDLVLTRGFRQSSVQDPSQLNVLVKHVVHMRNPSGHLHSYSNCATMRANWVSKKIAIRPSFMIKQVSFFHSKEEKFQDWAWIHKRRIRADLEGQNERTVVRLIHWIELSAWGGRPLVLSIVHRNRGKACEGQCSTRVSIHRVNLASYQIAS